MRDLEDVPERIADHGPPVAVWRVHRRLQAGGACCDGTLVDAVGVVHRVRWGERVRRPELSRFDATMHASYGARAQIARWQAAVDDVASFDLAWRVRNTGITAFRFDGRGRLLLDMFNALPHLRDPKEWTLR